MSRFEINPDTREPYRQEPPEQHPSAKQKLSAAPDERETQRPPRPQVGIMAKDHN